MLCMDESCKFCGESHESPEDFCPAAAYEYDLIGDFLSEIGATA